MRALRCATGESSTQARTSAWHSQASCGAGKACGGPGSSILLIAGVLSFRAPLPMVRGRSPAAAHRPLQPVVAVAARSSRTRLSRRLQRAQQRPRRRSAGRGRARPQSSLRLRRTTAPASTGGPIPSERLVRSARRARSRPAAGRRSPRPRRNQPASTPQRKEAHASPQTRYGVRAAGQPALKRY